MFLTALNNFLRAFVYANLWVGMAVAGLTATSLLVFGKADSNIVAFTFFATLAAYAYARKFEAPARMDGSTSTLTRWTSTNPAIFWLSASLGFLGAVWFAQYLKAESWPWVALCAALSAVYPWQFMAGKTGGLRNIGGLKLFVISTVWAIVTVVLPAVQTGLGLTTQVIWLALQRFLFVTAITIPFDIRDLRIDSPAINTLPYLMGVKRARFVAHLAILVAEIGSVFMYLTDVFTTGVLAGHLIAFEIASLLIYRSSPKRPDFFFSFWVEGTSVLLFLLVYLFNYFWP